MKDLHNTIRKFRVIFISVIAFLMWLTLDVWEYIKLTLPELSDWQGAVLATAFSTLIAGLFAVAKASSSKHEKDDDHAGYN